MLPFQRRLGFDRVFFYFLFAFSFGWTCIGFSVILVLRIGEGTHRKKQHPQSHIPRKGETPMKKNVVVVDEFGHEYEATYPKRAKGLVKSGRARFVDANRICLLRPPEQNLEDKHMEQNTSALTAREIFDQIVKLQNDLKNIRETTELIQTIRDTNQYNGNDSVELDPQVVTAKIDALVDVFESREGTYQQMLSVYEKMYDDVTGESAEQE